MAFLRCSHIPIKLRQLTDTTLSFDVMSCRCLVAKRCRCFVVSVFRLSVLCHEPVYYGFMTIFSSLNTKKHSLCITLSYQQNKFYLRKVPRQAEASICDRHLKTVDYQCVKVIKKIVQSQNDILESGEISHDVKIMILKYCSKSKLVLRIDAGRLNSLALKWCINNNYMYW